MARKPSSEITIGLDLAKILSDVFSKLNDFIDVTVKLKIAELERLTQENELHRDEEVTKLRLDLIKARLKKKIFAEKLPAELDTAVVKKPTVDSGAPLRGSMRGLENLEPKK